MCNYIKWIYLLIMCIFTELSQKNLPIADFVMTYIKERKAIHISVLQSGQVCLPCLQGSIQKTHLWP